MVSGNRYRLNTDGEPINNPAVRWPLAKGEMATRVREHAWADTPLGPVETWPPSLKSVVDVLLENGFPMVAMWGPDLIQAQPARIRGDET